MDASYCGGVDPYSETDAGLGEKGDPFYFSYHGGCIVLWTFCGALDMDAGVAALEGGPHGWLSGGHHGSGDGILSWSCGRREVMQRVAQARYLSLMMAAPQSGSDGNSLECIFSS